MRKLAYVTENDKIITTPILILKKAQEVIPGGKAYITSWLQNASVEELNENRFYEYVVDNQPEPTIFHNIVTITELVNNQVITSHTSVSKGIEEIRKILISKLADKRYNVQTSGITVNDLHIKSDSESIALITGAFNRVQRHPDEVVQFKTNSGVFVAMDKAAIEGIFDLVSDHIDACFKKEQQIAASINSATTIEELEAIYEDINTEWPGA